MMDKRDIFKNLKKLFPSDDADLSILSTLKHTSEGLSSFLKLTIALVDIGKGRLLICTSWPPLIEKFRPVQRSVVKPITRKFDFVLTYDLEKSKFASVSGKDWHIVDFVIIKTKEVDKLFKGLKKILEL
jgi:hypothetical protein